MQKLLTAREAAALATRVSGVHMTPDALSRIAARGRGPIYRRCLDNGRRLFEAESVRAWASARIGPSIATRDVPNFAAAHRGIDRLQ